MPRRKKSEEVDVSDLALDKISERILKRSVTGLVGEYAKQISKEVLEKNTKKLELADYLIERYALIAENRGLALTEFLDKAVMFYLDYYDTITELVEENSKLRELLSLLLEVNRPHLKELAKIYARQYFEIEKEYLSLLKEVMV